MDRYGYEIRSRFPGDFGLGDRCQYCGCNHEGECEEKRRFDEEQEVEELQRQEFEWHQETDRRKKLAVIEKMVKEIHWGSDVEWGGKGNCIAFIQVSASGGATLANFKKMADVLKESFPQLIDNEICCMELNETIIVSWRSCIPNPCEHRYVGWIQNWGTDV